MEKKNNMEQIIKKAIEGGWDKDGWENFTMVLGGIKFHDGEHIIGGAGNLMQPAELFMRSDFWQALGKACGWEKVEKRTKCEEVACLDIPYGSEWSNFCSRCGTGLTIFEKSTEKWKSNALKFHEINLTQGFDKAVEWLSNLIQEK